MEKDPMMASTFQAIVHSRMYQVKMEKNDENEKIK